LKRKKQVAKLPQWTSGRGLDLCLAIGLSETVLGVVGVMFWKGHPAAGTVEREESCLAPIAAVGAIK
jgi:hypothetical protein